MIGHEVVAGFPGEAGRHDVDAEFRREGSQDDARGFVAFRVGREVEIDADGQVAAEGDAPGMSRGDFVEGAAENGAPGIGQPRLGCSCGRRGGRWRLRSVDRWAAVRVEARGGSAGCAAGGQPAFKGDEVLDVAREADEEQGRIWRSPPPRDSGCRRRGYLGIRVAQSLGGGGAGELHAEIGQFLAHGQMSGGAPGGGFVHDRVGCVQGGPLRSSERKKNISQAIGQAISF